MFHTKKKTTVHLVKDIIFNVVSVYISQMHTFADVQYFINNINAGIYFVIKKRFKWYNSHSIAVLGTNSNHFVHVRLLT